MRSLDVALVATLPDGDESLALAYLSTALRQSGHRPHLLTFRTYHDMGSVAERIIALQPDLVGLALPSGHAAIDILALLHRIRDRGFRNHVTCGGAYATLARQRLMRDFPGIDSVVRHEGEVTIVRLADALESGTALTAVPGLTTRQGDGPAAPVDDDAGLEMIPWREPSHLYAGVPSAKISAVRGCWGECRYCGLAALRADATREAQRRGLSEEATRRAGVGRMRRRSVDHVADEMAALYHERGVRYFHFVDENHLPRAPEEACRVIEKLTEALESRGVGNRALSLMLRADVATKDVVDRLVHLGVVRCLLGVESNTRDGLVALGRGSAVETNLAAVENLTRREISFHFNLLLIRPDSTFQSLQSEVAALRGLDGGLLDPFHVEVLEGTRLFARLESEGRLEGGPHLWHFWPTEPSARRFAELFFALKRSVMGRQQLTPYAYEVLGTLAVAGRLNLLGRHREGLVRKAHQDILAHNELWLRLLEEALELAAHPNPKRHDALLRDGAVAAASATLRFGKLLREIRGASGSSLHTNVHYPRTMSALTLATSILAASCGGRFQENQPQITNPSVLDGTSDLDAAVDSPHERDGTIDAEADAVASCTLTIAQEELDEIRSAASCEDVCGRETFGYRFVLDDGGHVVDMERDDGVAIPESIKRCYLEAVAKQVFPCLAEQPVWVPCIIALK